MQQQGFDAIGEIDIIDRMQFSTMTFLQMILVATVPFSAIDAHASKANHRPKPKPQILDAQKTLEPIVTEERNSESQPPACRSLSQRDIEFAEIDPIIGENGCGIEHPVSLTKIGNTSLIGSTTLNCKTAAVFTDWVEQVRSLSQSFLGADLNSIQVSATYVCRRRNNKPDGKLSEHALGNAVDVSGFTLTNNERLSVLTHWPDPKLAKDPSIEKTSLTATKSQPTEEQFLRMIHRQACAYFTTVIGPDGDKYHRDHFHFDTSCRGETCSYKICQ